MGVSEDEIRSQLANKHDMSMEAVARRLHELGTFEQGKGQRGLSKFLVKWKEAAETSPESEGQTSSWSVIPEGPVGVPSQRSRMSSASASPSVPPPPGIPGSWEQRTVGLVRPPATYGNNDRKAGAVSIQMVVVHRRSYSASDCGAGEPGEQSGGCEFTSCWNCERIGKAVGGAGFLDAGVRAVRREAVPQRVWSELGTRTSISTAWGSHEATEPWMQAEDDDTAGDWAGWAVLGHT